MESYEKRIRKLLRSLGLNGSYKGFWYIGYGVQKIIEEPELLLQVSKGVYLEIGTHYQATIGCVERNIRTAREVVWKNADEELRRQVFGNVSGGSLNNAAFIDALAQYIIDEYE